MAYDLCLQAPSGTLLPLSEQRRLFNAFLLETRLNEHCEITDFGTGPLRGSFRKLQELISEGKFVQDEFDSFCKANSLVPDASEKMADAAAEAFMDYKWGQTLFVPKLPHQDADAKEAYMLIVDFARRHKLVLHDPQLGKDIDLTNPGDFPPMWGPRRQPEQPKRRWFF